MKKSWRFCRGRSNLSVENVCPLRPNSSMNSSCRSRCLLFRADRAGVIVNDFPAVRKFLPDEREHSPDVAALALQVPLAKNERRVRPQVAKLQIREIQLAHRSVIWVALFVPRQHAIPAA